MNFRVGITPDFYTDAKGSFEIPLSEKLGHLPLGPMPACPGNIATPESLACFDAALVLATRFTASSLAGSSRLAIVARWGVGYDNIDVPALTAAGVALAITPGAVRRPVAEAILTLIFALAKDLRTQDRLVRQGKWRADLPRLGGTIGGSVLGSVGCGNIARELFRQAQSLGFARMLACDPYSDPASVRELGVELVSLDQVLAESDFVCVNAFLNASTRGLIGEAQMRLMKSSAFLINTARGPLVDQAALTRALQERRIAGAGLDVFEVEPLNPHDPLLQLDNVIVAPHGLAWTAELARDNTLEACDNILAISRGEAPPGLVNREVLDSPQFQAKLERIRAYGL